MSRPAGHSLPNFLLALLLAWLAGLALFVIDASEFEKGKPVRAGSHDGIVVLTGGSNRVEAGLDLLQAGAAPRLLISGVDPRADPARLVPETHPAHARLSCCITIGTYAADTWGNAREAASWARNFGMKSLLIVTSNYHMRRSLFEFGLVLRGVRLSPHALTPHQVRLSRWRESPGTASLLIAEYTKLLLAWARAPLHRMFDVKNEK